MIISCLDGVLGCPRHRRWDAPVAETIPGRRLVIRDISASDVVPDPGGVGSDQAVE
jgi:hypothetical protein